MSTFGSYLVAGASLVSLVVLQAQETGQRRDREAGAREKAGRAAEVREKAAIRTGQDAQSSSRLDHYVVSCLKADNNGEITIATLGAQQATNPDVKAFAQEMVKDHTDFLAKLDRFAQEHPGTSASGARIRTEAGAETGRPGADRKDADNREGQNSESKNRDRKRDKDSAESRTERANAADSQRDRPGVQVDVNRGEVAVSRRGGQADITNQLMQIKQEISQKCVASAQRELESKQGGEFDKCFIGMQIGAHMHMADALAVLSNHVSDDLQQILEEGEKSTQRHLEHAKALAKKLEGASSESGERSTPSDAKSERKNREKGK